MDGTAPEQVRRSLGLGNQVFRSEPIETSPVGSGQLVLLDQTSRTVASRSEIAPDEYVYNPETNTGEISLSISRGMLRLIGGQITKRNSAIMRTPVATVRVRGGMVIVEVDDTTTCGFSCSPGHSPR